MNRTIYSHSDGYTLAFSDHTLIATYDEGKTVSLPIGSTDLMELGNALLALAAKQEEKFTSERAGAVMGHDLINELLAVRGEPQREAFRTIHDKLYALFKLEHFESAAGGIGGAVVNVLEIGISNLPKFKQEGCKIKARFYALTCLVLPYVSCGSMGTLMMVLLQLFEGA
ncbi:MAG: hypothetical protein ABIR56_10790 [Polaromonas sp.]